jgi:plastocyanin
MVTKHPHRGAAVAWALGLCVLVATVVALAGCAAPPAGTIVLQDLRFEPSELTVTKGTTVTWLNKDQIPVQIQSDDFGATPEVPGQFSSEPLNPGESFTHTFDTAGEFGYSDPFHPYITGKVTVR